MTWLEAIVNKVESFDKEIISPLRSEMAWQDTIDSIFNPEKLRQRRKVEAIAIPIAFLLWCLPYKKGKKKA